MSNIRTNHPNKTSRSKKTKKRLAVKRARLASKNSKNK